MRWAILLILCLCLQLPGIAAAKTVRVCIYENPPLIFTDQNGRAQGLLPELLTAVAKNNGWQLQFTSTIWPECLAQLEAGTVDVLPAIAYTEQRAQKFRFAQETVLTNWGQIYQQQGAELDTILKLAERKLAVLKDDVHYVGANGIHKIAEKFDVNLNYVEVANYLEAFTLLERGDVDAALVNRFFGLKQQQKFAVQPTTILLNPIQIRPAFSQFSDPALQADFDRTLAAWKENQESIYFQLVNKWIANGSTTIFPVWLKLVLASLAVLFCLMVLVAFWTRQQVKLKTKQLAGKNRQLEEELIVRGQVEKELRERQQQYRVLFEEAHTPILLIDPNTALIVDSNLAAAKFYQYRREQLQGMNIGEINGLSEEAINSRINKIERREKQQFEFTHQLANGEYRDVEVYSSPITIDGHSLLCSIVHDISRRKQFARQLEERNNFLQSVLDSVSDPMMVIDFDFQVLQMNKAAEEQTPPVFALHKTLTCHQRLHGSKTPCDDEDLSCPLQEVRETGEAVTLVHTHTSNQGPRLIELNAAPLRNANGEMYAIIEIARDITERQQFEELLSANEKRLHHLAHHDSLTDLPNRLLFEDRLKQAISKARRSRKQVALFFLDLDLFKEINDNLGHDFGDLLLVDIAGRLRTCVRESDTVARMGGDEFLVLLDDIESIEMVENMADRVGDVLTHELSHEGYSQRISASIGISIYPEDGVDGPELMKHADIAMYRAKDLGKANYQFFSPPQSRLPFG